MTTDADEYALRVLAQVDAWAVACCDLADTWAKTRTAPLLASYSAWAAGNMGPVLTMAAFGRALSALGHLRLKDRSGNIIRLGIALKAERTNERTNEKGTVRSITD